MVNKSWNGKYFIQKCHRFWQFGFYQICLISTLIYHRWEVRTLVLVNISASFVKFLFKCLGYIPICLIYWLVFPTWNDSLIKWSYCLDLCCGLSCDVALWSATIQCDAGKTILYNLDSFPRLAGVSLFSSKLTLLSVQ